MSLIERQEFLNLWESIDKGGLLRVVPEPQNPNRTRGAPMQNPEELWILLKRLEENIQEFGPIITILELGTADGGGLFVWNKILEKNGKGKDNLLITVDHGPNILWDYKNSSVNIRSIVGGTHEEGTRLQVEKILKDNNRKVDFLFIDAGHWPEEVKKDLIDYGSFVDDNRIIAFHDTRLMRSYWDVFTGNGIDALDNPKYDIAFKNEIAIFHKEEIKYTLGTGIFWKTRGQTVVKFRED